MTHTAAGRTAGERQLAAYPIISHVTSDPRWAASCKPFLPTVMHDELPSHPTGPRRWNANGAHLHLPHEMQDELQSDPLGAALEETKAQVESSEVSLHQQMVE